MLWPAPPQVVDEMRPTQVAAVLGLDQIEMVRAVAFLDIEEGQHVVTLPPGTPQRGPEQRVRQVM